VHGAASVQGGAVLDDPAQFVERRQPPVTAAAEFDAVDVLDVSTRVAFDRKPAHQADFGLEAGVAAVVLAVRIEPQGAPLVVPGVAGVVDLDLPEQPGVVVLRAGPVLGIGAEWGFGRELAAVVADLGEVEAAGAAAVLGEYAVEGRSVAAEARVE